MRKTVSILLALVLVLTMSAPVWAAAGQVSLADSTSGTATITLSGIDTSQTPGTFTVTDTDMTGQPVQRAVPIYPATGTVTAATVDTLGGFSVTKMVDLGSGKWSFDGPAVTITGKGVYQTYEDPAPSAPSTDGYDNSAQIGTTVDHEFDLSKVSEIPEDAQDIFGFEYQVGCKAEMTEPGLYYVFGTYGPVAGYTAGFVRITAAEAAPAAPTNSTVIPKNPAGGFYPSDWARAEVNGARNTGLVPNYWYRNYDCLANTTRLQFCELATELYCVQQKVASGLLVTPMEPTFSDCSSHEVEVMYSLGVVDGMGGGKFAPQNELTREQAAKILTLLYNKVVPGAYDANTNYWTGSAADAASVSTWAQNYVGFVMNKGIMNGVGNNKFDPKGKYTMQQAMLTMYRLAGRTDMWTAPGDGGLTVFDLGINRSVYSSGVIYSSSAACTVECSAVRLNGSAAEFTTKNEEGSGMAFRVNVPSNTMNLNRYEFDLKVTAADGTVYTLTDSFQYIEDGNGFGA